MNQCYAPVYSQNIGPFTGNTNLGIITVPASTSGIVNVSGKLMTCSGTPVVNGYAIIVVDNIVRYARVDSSNGNFSSSVLICSGAPGNYSVTGVDATALQQGNPVTGTLTAPATALGNIAACGNSAAQYINYTLDGTNYSHVPPADSLTAWTRQVQPSMNWTTTISGNTMNTGSITGISFEFTSPSQIAGSYAIASLRVRTFLQGNTPVAPFDVNITNFPTVIGQFYEGNLNGQFRDASNVLHTLSATFRIRKNF
jgi:hypothetical protein